MARFLRYDSSVIDSCMLCLVEGDSGKPLTTTVTATEFSRGGDPSYGYGKVFHAKAVGFTRQVLKMPDSSYYFLISGWASYWGPHQYGIEGDSYMFYYCPGGKYAYRANLTSSSRLTIIRYSMISRHYMTAERSNFRTHDYNSGISHDDIISYIARSAWEPREDRYALETVLEYHSPPGTRALLEYRLNERSNFTAIEIGYIPKDLKCKLCLAFEDAVRHVPQATVNGIGSILELASAVRTLIKRPTALLPSTGSSAWLGYRYSYSTTKADLAEISELTSRLVDLTDAHTITCYGSYTSAGATYRCQFSLDASSILPHTTSERLRKYGVKLSLYNAWDMVPYSFIVDWFLDIGQFIDRLESLGCLALPYTNFWYSVKTAYATSSGMQEVYYRFPGTPIVTSEWFDATQTTNKTTLFRIADSVALMFRR